MVGEQPVLEPGQSFTYSSGCPLKTPQGLMVGSYQMVDGDGRTLDVAIPAFSLDSPFCRPVLIRRGCPLHLSNFCEGERG